MGHKKQTPDSYGLEELPLTKDKEKASKQESSKKNDKEYIIKIEAVEITDDNIGFVVANLRFYKWDARNSDYGGASKKPFKIYENSWELGTSIKKKIAEFETIKEQEAAFKAIITEYTNDFKKKYKLTRRKAPKDQGKGSPILSDSPISNGPEGVSPSNIKSEDSSVPLPPNPGE